jgi:hypothetical protein
MGEKEKPQLTLSADVMAACKLAMSGLIASLAKVEEEIVSRLTGTLTGIELLAKLLGQLELTLGIKLVLSTFALSNDKRTINHQSLLQYMDF